MKKSFFILLAAAVTLVSCDKFGKQEKGESMIEFAARYGQTVTVPTNDYVAETTEELQRVDNDRPYNSGSIAYKVNGETQATIDFGFGGEMEAQVVKGANTETVKLGEEKEEKYEYDKVVVEPLIYSERCGYVVAGILKFYKEKQWVATFDYGDGTCDDLITKYTEDNSVGYIFSMDDYPEFNK